MTTRHRSESLKGFAAGSAAATTLPTKALQGGQRMLQVL